MFSIVLFREENAIEGVPSCWLSEVGGKMFCYWPSKSEQLKLNMTKIIQRRETPLVHWSLFACEMKGKSNSYEEMRKMVTEMSFMTATESESDDDRDQSTVNEGLMPLTDSSEEELPEPPKKNLKSVSTSSGAREKKSDTENVETAQIEPLISTVALSNVSQPLTQKHTSEKEKSMSRDEFHGTELLRGNHKTDDEEESQGKIMKCLQLIYKEILNVKEEQKLIKRALKKTVHSLPDLDSKLPPLPVKTAADLEGLELILGDEIEQKNLVSKLSNFGSSSLRSTVHSIMKNTIASEVAVLYSLHGKGEKKPFIDLKLFSCIQGE